MATIKEYLKEKLKDAYTDEISGEVDKLLGSGYVPKDVVRVDYIEKISGLEKEITKRDEQIDALKKSSGDADELKKQIDTYQAENKTLKESHDQELTKLKFDFRLEGALLAAGAKNATAVKGLLKTENLKLDGDTIIGLEEQLTAIKKSDAYLFDEAKTKVPGTGGNPPTPPGQDTQKKPTAEGRVIF